jgi:hypothetical protein
MCKRTLSSSSTMASPTTCSRTSSSISPVFFAVSAIPPSAALVRSNSATSRRISSSLFPFFFAAGKFSCADAPCSCRARAS